MFKGFREIMAMGLRSGYSDVSLGHEAAVRVVDSIVNGESIRIVPLTANSKKRPGASSAQRNAKRSVSPKAPRSR
ncbi:MAG: hypothetical protein ACE5O2_05150 [Armatimonadota bacterium]